MNKKYLVWGAVVAGALLFFYWPRPAKKMPTLAELNPNGGGSVFERFGNGRD